jgi:hypothetical protein
MSDKIISLFFFTLHFRFKGVIRYFMHRKVRLFRFRKTSPIMIESLAGHVKAYDIPVSRNVILNQMQLEVMIVERHL